MTLSPTLKRVVPTLMFFDEEGLRADWSARLKLWMPAEPLCRATRTWMSMMGWMLNCLGRMSL